MSAECRPAGRPPLIFPVWRQHFPSLCPLSLQLHRMLMLTTSALTCIAFILPFIYRGGWSWVCISQTGFLIQSILTSNKFFLVLKWWVKRHSSQSLSFYFKSPEGSRIKSRVSGLKYIFLGTAVTLISIRYAHCSFTEFYDDRVVKI